MEIHYHTEVTDQQRGRVEKWATAHQDAEIDSIDIHAGLVSVQTSRDSFAVAAGTAIRRDDLEGELSAALANLHRLSSRRSQRRMRR